MNRNQLVIVGAFALSLFATSAAIGRNDINSEVLDELNFLRANPTDYAAELDDFQRRFEGTLIISDGDGPDMITNEGVRPVIEAARELRRTRPLGPIDSSAILAKAAADHVRAQGSNGETGHISSSRTPGQRVKAHGGDIYVGEVIVYGQSDPRDAIRQLVVDDGVANRGHRKLLLSPQYKYAGVACGPHRIWRNMCVIDLSETPDGSAP